MGMKINGWPLLVAGILQALLPAPPREGAQHAVVELSLLVIGIGLAYLAGQLLKKNKNLIQDDKPTTLATRGSYVPVLKGRRRLGFVFTYAGNRHTRKEKAKQGGKGNVFSQKVDVFLEDGMHVMAVGPCHILWEVEQSGKPLFVGPITSVSHPSGSTIDLGNEGSFRIFWGEVDQPVNSYMGDVSRIGIASRWPRFCYIEWRNKRLGDSPVWPSMTYVLESRPTESPLLDTDSFIDADQEVDPGYVPFAVNDVVTGAQGTAYWEIVGRHDGAPFRPLQALQLNGNSGLGTEDYEILKVEVTDTTPGPIVSTFLTRIFPIGGIAGGATADGTLTAYRRLANDGWNGAHMLAEWLFGAHPIGLGLDQSEWDMDSLEELGTLIDTTGEDLRCGTIAPDGQDAQTLIGGIMADLGVLIPLNMQTGLLQFYPIRFPVGTLAEIDQDALLDRPEIEVSGLANRSSDRLIFSFQDEANYFRDMTIGVDDDGQIAKQTFYRAKTVQIISTSVFATAAQMTERRSFEEMAGGGRHRIQVGREARTLLPGQPVIVYGFDEVLRIDSTAHDPLSGNVSVTVMPDFYGAPLSDFITGQGDTGGVGQVVVEDPISAMVEVPEALTGAGGPMTLIPLAVRGNSGVTAHNIHISRDDTTYTFYGNDLTVITGGLLIDPLPATSLGEFGFYELAEGPTFTALGPDIASVLDLSADLVSWRGGRQLCVLVDPSTGVQEICFLKKVTNVVGDIYRLDGLIRARYDTRKLAFSADTEVYILQNDDGTPVQDPLLEPEVTLYSKSEPTGFGSIPLSQIQPDGISLYGKGIRPVPVSEVRLSTEETFWTPFTYVAQGSAPDDDLVITWSYSTPQSPLTGAGMFAAGATVADVVPEGSFLVEILSSGDVLQRSDTVAIPSYTYLRADRLADFSGEPASFKVRVTQLRDGYLADPVTVTITQN